VIAPTGTIGLVMDCDTTGIEPDFALVKFKKLAGGGYFKIINRAVPEALRTLGYSEAQIGRDRGLRRRPRQHRPGAGINPGSLKAKGFTDTRSRPSTALTKAAFDIKFVFNKLDAGRGLLQTCSGHRRKLNDPAFDMLSAIWASSRRTSRPPTSMSAGR
jgi:ribonucleoside-diphosphate reductase alpha chain